MSGLLQLRAAQFQNHRVRVHGCAGPDIYFFYAPFRVRRDPANVLRHKRAESAHLTRHWAAFNGIDPDGGAVDARHCWFQARDGYRRDK